MPAWYNRRQRLNTPDLQMTEDYGFMPKDRRMYFVYSIVFLSAMMPIGWCGPGAFGIKEYMGQPPADAPKYRGLQRCVFEVNEAAEG